MLPSERASLTDSTFAAAARPVKLALVLLGLAWVLPFFSPSFFAPISSFYGEVTAFVLGLLALSLLPLRSLWAGLRLPRVSLVFLAFAGLILLQAALGRTVYPQLNFLAALYLLWATALALLAMRLRDVLGLETLATALSWFVLAGALISAAIGLIQLLGIATPVAPFILPRAYGRIYANTGQPNHLADYLCLGLVSLGFLWSTRRLPIAASAPAGVLLLLVLAASGSRSVWLYLPALVALSAGFSRTLPDRDVSTRLLRFSVALVAGFALAQFVPEMLGLEAVTARESVAERMRALAPQASTRLRLCYEAWLMLRSAPLMGTGFAQFAWNNFLLNTQLPSAGMEAVITHHAHNLIMHTAAEFGLVGLALLLVGVGYWLRGLRAQRASPQLWWSLGILAILLIHSMLEYPLWYAYFLGVAAVTLAAGESTAINVGTLRSGRLVMVLMLLLGWLTVANVYRDYRTMQVLQGSQAAWSNPASQFPQSTTRVLLDLQRRSLFAPYIELALVRRMTLNREHLSAKIALNGNVMRLFPDTDVVYRQAILLALNGERDAARLQWDRAATSFPAQRTSAAQVVEALVDAGEPQLREFLAYAQATDSKESK